MKTGPRGGCWFAFIPPLGILITILLTFTLGGCAHMSPEQTATITGIVTGSIIGGVVQGFDNATSNGNNQQQFRQPVPYLYPQPYYIEQPRYPIIIHRYGTRW